ncbi:hypothetical protein [Microbacterium sp. bgisy203]|uniref:hypothetical protein n=1 Tax=Microbacterium sp. bgisy203 TaxID=3413799 RepID=UPI003D70C268
MHSGIRLITVGIAVVAAFLFSGCGATADATVPSPTASTQSVAAACDVVREAVASAAAGLQQLDATDPAASATAMTEVAGTIGEAVAGVANADVGAELPRLQTGFSDAAAALQAIAGGDLGALPRLQEATGTIGSSLTALGELCGAS